MGVHADLVHSPKVFELAEILFRPTRVFAKVRARPQWVAPFLATVLLFFASTLALIQMATMELITLQRFQRDSRLSARVGEASINNAVDSSNTRIPKLIILSRDTAFAAVLLISVAGILMVAASAMDAKPRPGFARMLAMTSFAVFPFALLKLVGTIALLGRAGDLGTINLDHVVSLSMAQLIDPASVSPPVLALAQGMDLLMVAQIVFLAYGFSKVAALPFWRCLGVCAILWVIAIIWTSAAAVWF